MRRKGFTPKDEYPGLLKWDLYIKLLGEPKSTPPKKPQDELWFEIFVGGTDFFFQFFSEWLSYVSIYINDK